MFIKVKRENGDTFVNLNLVKFVLAKRVNDKFQVVLDDLTFWTDEDGYYSLVRTMTPEVIIHEVER